MKKAVALLALLTLLFCLTGCFGKPSEGKTNATAQKGEQMMREWLASRYPDAELKSAEPYGSTALVSGTFQNGDEKQKYWLDTLGGTVYFEQSEETMEQLGALCAPYMADALGLGGQYEVATTGVYIDIGVRAANGIRPNVLPADFVRSGKPLESFIRSPKERPTLTADISFRVPDGFDVSHITLAETRQAINERNLAFEYFTVESGSEEIELRPEHAVYKRMGFGDLPDFRVWMPVYERDERLKSTGEVETKTTEREVGRDLIVERASDGFYKPNFPNGWFHALVYAYEGSEMLRHTYYYVSDNNRTVELEWRETERGWQLGSDDNYLSDTRSFAELN